MTWSVGEGFPFRMAVSVMDSPPYTFSAANESRGSIENERRLHGSRPGHRVTHASAQAKR
jgi:hypothetical protein